MLRLSKRKRRLGLASRKQYRLSGRNCPAARERTKSTSQVRPGPAWRARTRCRGRRQGEDEDEDEAGTDDGIVELEIDHHAALRAETVNVGTHKQHNSHFVTTAIPPAPRPYDRSLPPLRRALRLSASSFCLCIAYDDHIVRLASTPPPQPHQRDRPRIPHPTKRNLDPQRQKDNPQ